MTSSVIPTTPTSASSCSRFQCDVCQKLFKRQRTVAVHRRIHFADTPQGKPFKCSHCPAAFSQCQNLSKHRWVHTGGWPYACDVCDAVFRCSVSLKKHKKVHLPNYLKNWLEHHKTTQDPVKCEVCGALFTLKMSFHIHQVIHQQHEVHTCGVCNATYTERSQLDNHINFIHKSLKPFRCSECDAEFAKKNELAAHKFLHKRKSSNDSVMRDNDLTP